MQLKFNDKDKEILKDNRQLKQYANDLIRRQQQILKQKIIMQQERVQRIKQRDQRLQLQNEKRNNQYLNKGQKAKILKMEHLSKIVKNCQKRNKFVQKKYQQQTMKKNRSLNQAWIKSQQLTNQILNNKKNKSTNKQKYTNKTEVDNQTKSVMIGNIQVQQKSKIKINNNSAYIVNASHHNKANIHYNTVYHFTQHFQNNQKYDSHSVCSQQQIKFQQNKKNTNKIQQVKNRQLMIQQQKIQKLGQRLTKIQNSRIKKMQNNKKKKSQTLSHQRNYQSLQRNIKLNQTHNNRNTSSQNHTYLRQKRLKNYQNHNRQKRIQAFQNNIQNGNIYLKKLKAKTLKTILAKNIAYNALQKKLYYQRLKN